MIATVVWMAPPHRAGATLELAIIESCCCMDAIAYLKSTMLLLLQCAIAFLTMINAAKPSRIVSRMSSSFASIILFAYPCWADVPAPVARKASYALKGTSDQTTYRS